MRAFRTTSMLTLEPPLRLGLVFFDDADTRAVQAIVHWLASDQLPWRVVDEGPVHALLMARGPRMADPAHLAVLRLSADAEAAGIARYGDAMPAMALRKPLQPMHLRIVLEMAAASLIPEYIATVSPHTRPLRNPLEIQRPATLV
jgi:hypothetical protein